MEQKQFPRFNRQEADVIVAKMKEMLGPDAAALVEKSGLNANHMVRFMHIGSMCRTNREKKTLDLNSNGSRVTASGQEEILDIFDSRNTS